VLNIDEQRSTRKALEWSAAHDGLTGLANRQRFDQHARRLIEARPASLPAAMVFIDLDHFKEVNDTGGHLSGDAMLRAAAAAIMSRVRSGDLAARIGGDEFALLLEQCSHEAAVRVAEDIVASISAIALPWLSGSLHVGASIGVASLTPEIGTVDDWISAADAACYAAKAAGRGTVRAGLAPREPRAPSVVRPGSTSPASGVAAAPDLTED
jgi:diguanylate cyclase (GGDEF)-like protein